MVGLEALEVRIWQSGWWVANKLVIACLLEVVALRLRLVCDLT